MQTTNNIPDFSVISDRLLGEKRSLINVDLHLYVSPSSETIFVRKRNGDSTAIMPKQLTKFMVARAKALVLWLVFKRK